MTDENWMGPTTFLRGIVFCPGVLKNHKPQMQPFFILDFSIFMIFQPKHFWQCDLPYLIILTRFHILHLQRSTGQGETIIFRQCSRHATVHGLVRARNCGSAISYFFLNSYFFISKSQSCFSSSIQSYKRGSKGTIKIPLEIVSKQILFPRRLNQIIIIIRKMSRFAFRVTAEDRWSCGQRRACGTR